VIKKQAILRRHTPVFSNMAPVGSLKSSIKPLKQALGWKDSNSKQQTVSLRPLRYSALWPGVVARRLLDLREHLRVAPAQPAEECGLETLELEVLRLQSSRVSDTVQDVALALGRLGGHLNRRSDGLPGWQVLWRGMQQLQTLVEGVRLASRLELKFG
jgi:Transposase Tn5 dimerisation domain